MMPARNGRRWTIAIALLGAGVPLAASMAQIGWRVVTVCYYATRLGTEQGNRHLPIAPHASSEEALSRLGTSVAAVEQVRSRLDPRGDLLLLVTGTDPMDRGSLYLQMSYFLAPRKVAQLDCVGQPYLLTGAAAEERVGGIVYHGTSPPAWLVARHPVVSISGGSGPKRLLFVPFKSPAKEIRDWAQFCW